MSSNRRCFHVFYLCVILMLLSAFFWHNKANTELNKKPQLGSNNKILVDPLYYEIRVLCLVTYKYWYTNAARYVKRTWGQHCNVLLMVSGQTDEELEPYVPIENTSDNMVLVRQGLIYAYDYYKHDIDWLIKVEDFSFVALENLRYMLQSFATTEPIYLGYELKYPKTNFSFNYWKSGYVLSKEALRRYAIETKKPATVDCMPMNGTTEDTEISRCLSHLGVTTADTRDEFGYQTFIPLATSDLFIAGYEALSWLRNMSWHQTDGHTVPVSRRAISFSVAYHPKIYDLYYFTYEMHLFGKPVNRLP